MHSSGNFVIQNLIEATARLRQVRNREWERKEGGG